MGDLLHRRPWGTNCTDVPGRPTVTDVPGDLLYRCPWGTYCTDVAKAVGAPVLHVNGDDPASVVHAARIAYEYRQTFHRDVVVDVVCYRRRGHNEGDDPSFTQPHMYGLIAEKRSTRKLYTESLIGHVFQILL